MTEETVASAPTIGEAEGVADAVVVLPDRYRDEGLIGTGATGSVRRVRDGVVGQSLAMKIMHPALMGSPRARARFEYEATITARLRHPGIVSVHDRGCLPDGRPWFAMTEVQGRTIAAVIAAVHAVSRGRWRATPDGWTLRRLVDAFARLCQAVGHAHGEGIVHRDLKPANLMVGGFGEVLVMDWGLARESGRTEPSSGSAEPGEDPLATRTGDIMGTPAYMPPEQARGQLDAIGPPSDVYALGAVLFHLLAGRPPKVPSGLSWIQIALRPPPDVTEVVSADHPPLAPGLCVLVRRALAEDPADRFPDASALASEVLDWLDGARRRDRARALLIEPRARQPQVARLRARASEQRQAAAKALDAVPPYAPVAQKRAGWALEDQAQALEIQAAVEEAEWLRGVHAAMTVAPDLEDVHQMLAGHYHQKLEEAERRRDATDAARYEAMMRGHARGAHTTFLRGLGAVEIEPDADCSVTVYRYVERDRRLVPQRIEAPMRLPRLQLPRGSYLVELEAPGRACTRLPIAIRRGAAQRLTVHLPAAAAVGVDEILVPAGAFWSGGDRDAPDALPGQEVWIDDLVVARFPVTVGAYRRFLEEIATDPGALTQLGPVDADDAPMFVRSAAGGVHAPSGEAWRDDRPMVRISWDTAARYAAWWAERVGQPWRLPNELEWEKAARGTDGRFAPWGDYIDPTFAHVLDSQADVVGRAPVGAVTADESPYGVRDLAGNVQEWCANDWTHEGPALVGGRLAPAQPASAWKSVRGGCFSGTRRFCRSAARFAARPDRAYTMVGLRLVRSLSSSTRSTTPST